MHYGSDRPDQLTYDPFKAIVSPRPIGWIGTLNADGVANLGPYSFFAAISSRPNMVIFSSDGKKHSYVNAKARGSFTFSLATEALTQAMNISAASLPDGQSEFDAAGLTARPGIEVDAPFVGESPAALECVTVSAHEIMDRHGRPTDRFAVIGEVVRTHIHDDYITADGRFDAARARPISRLGYKDYATVERLWELDRPGSFSDMTGSDARG